MEYDTQCLRNFRELHKKQSGGKRKISYLEGHILYLKSIRVYDVKYGFVSTWEMEHKFYY